MTLEPIAYVYFDDSAKRPIFEGARGQFVVDDNGDRIDGVWFIPPKECLAPPLIVWADAERDREPG